VGDLRMIAIIIGIFLSCWSRVYSSCYRTLYIKFISPTTAANTDRTQIYLQRNKILKKKHTDTCIKHQLHPPTQRAWNHTRKQLLINRQVFRCQYLSIYSKKQPSCIQHILQWTDTSKQLYVSQERFSLTLNILQKVQLHALLKAES